MNREQRRQFLITIGALLATPFTAKAQDVARLRRIGYLNPATTNERLFEAFRQGLRDRGYIEGRNLVIEYRSGEGNPERLRTLAAELVALKPEVILSAAGTLAALAARQASDTIPIVFVSVGDPVTSGLVSSLARPGGNATGLSLLFPELVGKCLEQLKVAFPGASRVAVLSQPGAVPERAQRDILQGAEAAARALRLRLQVVEARGPEDFDRAFFEMTAARANALTVLSTPVFASARTRLVELAAKNRLPTVFSFREYVDAGGLMSYGPDLADLSRRAATYVDKILNGAKPGDLPVEQPSTFEFVINVKTAKDLGFTIPPSVLARADDLLQ